MKKQLAISTVVFAAVLTGASLCHARTMSWKNPIVRERADPHVFLHTDGYYYMVATVPEYDRIELRRARTIGGLSSGQKKTIWKKHDAGAMGAHIWAPEIHNIDGKWYVYFTSAPAESIWEIRPWVLECDDQNPLTGDWEEKGRINLAWESFALDGTTFAHKGKRYFVWTQRGNAPYDGTNIYIAEMDTPSSIIGDPVMLTYPDFEWETRGYRVNEAPAVLVSHGKVFLTYSASATDANYCLGMLTADDDANLLDVKSWTKSKDPVMKSYPENDVYGPGHNCFTTTPDGKKVIVVYHARDYEKIPLNSDELARLNDNPDDVDIEGLEGDPLHNPDRATRAQELKWNEDGTPNFGLPVDDGRYTLEY